jgi:transcriptional regulator with GAF, ATPase, and Fis domain
MSGQVREFERSDKDCLIKQNELLAILAESLSRLAAAEDVNLAIRICLEMVGEYTEMESVRLYRKVIKDAEDYFKLDFEWNLKDGLNPSGVISFPVASSMAKKAVPFVKKVTNKTTFRIPEHIKEYVKYCICCPVFSNNSLWGVTVYFSFSDDPEWVQSRLNALNLLAVCFGTVVSMRETLKQTKNALDYSLSAIKLIIESEQQSLKRQHFEALVDSLPIQDNA